MKPTRLDERVFDNLADASGEDLISVFIPTHKAGREIAQDRIRLKNQLASVDSSLTDLGWKPRERSERLSGAEALLEDVEFWEHQDHGLAVFIDDEARPTAVSISARVDPHGIVMPVFMLRPLVADIHPVRVPVLALTLDEAALFEATPSAVERMAVDLPSYADVNWFVDREVQRQQHPGGIGSGQNRHGHDVSSSSDEDFARFLREVSAAVKGYEPEVPLVVLGDDSLVARFSNQSERATVSPKHSGLSTPLSEAKVSEMVAGMVADISRSRVATAKSDALDKLGVGMGTTALDEALVAAMSGRVDRVIVDRTARHVWGRLNETTLHVDEHDEKRPGDVELLDRLVIWARSTGAEVVASETAIDDWSFIATFRY